MLRNVNSSKVRGAAVGLGAAVALGLGAVGTTTAAGASSATPDQAASAPPACATSALHVSLGQATGSAGHTTVPLVFGNGGKTSCTLYGYPGVSVVGTHGDQLGAAAERTSSGKPLVTLAPGQSANALLYITYPENYPASSCQPVTGTGFRVYPPNQRAAAYVPDQVETCANASVTTLEVQAVGQD